MEKLLNKKPYIIAEVGVNHNGNINIAKKIIDQLGNLKISAIKFQYFNAEELVDIGTKSAPYHQNLTKNQYEMLKLELSIDEILFKTTY